MPSIKTISAAFSLLLVLLSACKKDNSSAPVAPPNNDIIETTPPFQRPVTKYINQYVGGFYEALPNHYQVTTKKYPLLVFLHGGGQVGDGNKDLPLVLNDGIAKEINDRKFPANFLVKGSNYSFIVLSPQFVANPPDSMVLSFINYALANYRVDESRIYLTGLSMGGVLTTQTAGSYPSLFAAVVPVSGESFGTERDINAAKIAKGGLALWAFHNYDDPTISSTVATEFVNAINILQPLIPAKLTIFQAFGHDAWTQALSATYKENNMNVYEWMLQYKR